MPTKGKKSFSSPVGADGVFGFFGSPSLLPNGYFPGSTTAESLRLTFITISCRGKEGVELCCLSHMSAWQEA